MPGTQQFIELAYGDPAPEAFFDLTQEVLGTLGRLDLTVVNATTIRARAGAGADEAGMGIGGALRFIDANVDRAMPGGAAAGRFDVYVTSGPTTIEPGSPPVDTTDYSWDLAIVASGAAAPATAYSKLAGYLDWNGAAITRLVQTFGRRDDAPVAAVSGAVTVPAIEAIMPAAATAPAIRAQVGLTEVFRVGADGSVVATGGVSSASMTVSAAGSGAVTITAADGGLTLGGDVNLYRRQANVLGTDDNVWATLNVAAGVGSASQTTTGSVGPGATAGVLMNDVVVYRRAAALVGIDAGLSLGANLALRTDTGALVLGAAADTNLYRGGANQLRSDGSLALVGGLTVGGTLGVTGASTLASLAVTGNATVGGTLAVTGVLTAPTAAVDTATTQVATTAFVLGQGSAAGDGAPAMDGVAARGASTHWARADHVHPADTSRAPLASPVLTGAPTAPTAALNTNTTQIATTAYVVGQAGAAAPLMDGAAGSGVSLRYSREDHRHPTDTTLAPLASPTLTGTVTLPSLVSTATRIGFFGAAPALVSTGYGAAARTAPPVALSAGSTLNDVLAVVSSLVADLRTYGLIGA